MGREVHKFLVDQSGNRPWVGFPYPPLITCDWLNGLPEEDALYDASENLVVKQSIITIILLWRRGRTIPMRKSFQV